MAESEPQRQHKTHTTVGFIQRNGFFPPTITNHKEWSADNGDEPPHGIELFPMDSGTDDEPRSIFIPDDPEADTQWNL